MKYIFVLISLSILSACSDPEVEKIQAQLNKKYFDTTEDFNFPDTMKNCKAYLLYAVNDRNQTYYSRAIHCPMAMTTVSYKKGKVLNEVTITDQKNFQDNKDVVLKLFKEKTNFLENIQESTFTCAEINQPCNKNENGFSRCSIDQNQHYNCSVTQSKIVDNKIVENLVSMKCNTSECIL